MRKNAMVICCYVCVTAAFGAFFRWIQNQAAFETATGLVIYGSIWSKIVALLCMAAVLGGLALVIGLRKKDFYPARDCKTVFLGMPPVTTYYYNFMAVLMILGGAVLFVTSKYEQYATILRVLALFAILSGLSFRYLVAAPYKEHEDNLQCLCCTVMVLMYSYWLVVCYKLHAATPSAWTYGFEVLAIGTNAISFYYMAGYAFGRVRPYRSLFGSMTGAFLSLVTLPDGHYLGMQLMFLASAGMQLYFAWMIASNMRLEKPVSPAEESAAQPEA